MPEDYQGIDDEERALLEAEQRAIAEHRNSPEERFPSGATLFPRPQVPPPEAMGHVRAYDDPPPEAYDTPSPTGWDYGPRRDHAPFVPSQPGPVMDKSAPTPATWGQQPGQPPPAQPRFWGGYELNPPPPPPAPPPVQSAIELSTPSEQLARLGDQIRASMLNQPEQRRLAVLNQARSQVQEDQLAGKISGETAVRMQAQITRLGGDLWTRQMSLPRLLQAQRYLQMQDANAQQQAIQNMDATERARHVQMHTTTLPDGTQIYVSPNGREHIMRPQAQRPTITPAEHQAEISRLMGGAQLPASARTLAPESQMQFAQLRAEERFNERYQRDYQAATLRVRQELARARGRPNGFADPATPEWIRNRATQVSLPDGGQRAATEDDWVHQRAATETMHQLDAAGVLGSERNPIRRTPGQSAPGGAQSPPTQPAAAGGPLAQLRAVLGTPANAAPIPALQPAAVHGPVPAGGRPTGNPGQGPRQRRWWEYVTGPVG